MTMTISHESESTARHASGPLPEEKEIALSHDSSSSSEDDDDDDTPNLLSLEERRALKVARNNALLESMGLLKSRKVFPFQRRKAQQGEEVWEPNDEQEESFSRLQIAPSENDRLSEWSSVASKPLTTKERIERLIQEFPGRTKEIHRLWSLLSVPTSIPLFVVGPHGVGKTDCVRRILCCLQLSLEHNMTMKQSDSSKSKTQRQLVVSYLNIATCDGESWIAQIYHNVRQQLGMGRKKRKKTINTRQLHQKRARQESERAINASNKEAEKEIDERTQQEESKANSKQERPRRSSRASTVSSTKHSEDNTQKTKIGKKEGSKSHHSSDLLQDMAETTLEQGINGANAATGGGTSIMAVHALGRFLHQAFGTTQNRGSRMVLVLDQAELLLVSSKVNLLAQILLLPKNFDIPITIVTVTNSLFLAHSRLNQMLDSTQSVVGIMCNIQPIQVYFQSYNGKQSFLSILQSPRVCEMVTGENLTNSQPTEFHDNETGSFRLQLYKSFCNVVVTAISDSTRDVNEFIRIARLLWPIYTKPLEPSQIEQTYSLIEKNKGEKEDTDDSIMIVRYLDRKALIHFRPVLEKCLGVKSVSSSTHDSLAKQNPIDAAMSRMSRYMLLAAYLCQVNRPEQDRSLFSIAKNGRARKRTLNEDTISNSGSNKPSSIRLRSFPLERMLSIHVSLVSLHETKKGPGTRAWDSESLAQLQQAHDLNDLLERGVLQISGAETTSVKLSEPRYICHVTSYQAHLVADGLRFPLDRYTL